MQGKDKRKIIRIANSQLGELEINENSIIRFEQGIIGYESLKQFALIDIKECEPFLWLISINEPEISLPILKHEYIYPEYHIRISNRDREDLKIGKSDPFYLFFIVTVDEKSETVTANLKGPLAINLETRFGAQIIAPNEEYVVDYPILQNKN